RECRQLSCTKTNKPAGSLSGEAAKEYSPRRQPRVTASDPQPNGGERQAATSPFSMRRRFWVPRLQSFQFPEPGRLPSAAPPSIPSQIQAQLPPAILPRFADQTTAF